MSFAEGIQREGVWCEPFAGSECDTTCALGESPIQIKEQKS